MRLVENLVFGLIALAPVAVVGVGIALIWFSYVGPGLQQSAATNWVETPCTIQSIEIVYTPGDRDFPGTEAVRVAYQYAIDGRNYESTRYQFHGYGFREFEDADRLYVEEHPVGSATVCYVDPLDHSSAALLHERKLGYGMALLGSVFLAGSVVLARAMYGWSFGWLFNLLPTKIRKTEAGSSRDRTLKKAASTRKAGTTPRGKLPKRRRRKNKN